PDAALVRYTVALLVVPTSLFLILPRPPISTLFPYTTLFRSARRADRRSGRLRTRAAQLHAVVEAVGRIEVDRDDRDLAGHETISSPHLDRGLSGRRVDQLRDGGGQRNGPEGLLHGRYELAVELLDEQVDRPGPTAEMPLDAGELAVHVHPRVAQRPGLVLREAPAFDPEPPLRDSAADLLAQCGVGRDHAGRQNLELRRLAEHQIADRRDL